MLASSYHVSTCHPHPASRHGLQRRPWQRPSGANTGSFLLQFTLAVKRSLPEVYENILQALIRHHRLVDVEIMNALRARAHARSLPHVHFRIDEALRAYMVHVQPLQLVADLQDVAECGMAATQVLEHTLWPIMHALLVLLSTGQFCAQMEASPHLDEGLKSLVAKDVSYMRAQGRLSPEFVALCDREMRTAIAFGSIA